MLARPRLIQPTRVNCPTPGTSNAFVIIRQLTCTWWPSHKNYMSRNYPVLFGTTPRLQYKEHLPRATRYATDIARRLKIRENALFNLSRELRLLGVTEYEPNRVRLIGEIWESADREKELRARVAAALRNHRAFSILTELIAQQGVATLDEFARGLPSAFPAVEIKATTWRTYARSFLLWFEYAGLAMRSDQRWIGTPDALGGKGQLLGAKLTRKMRTGFLHERPGEVLKVANSVATGSGKFSSSRPVTRAIRSLTLLGALVQDPNGQHVLTRSDLFHDGELVPEVLYEMISIVPGVAGGLAILRANPGASPEDVGEAVRRSLGADWQRSTKVTIGKNLRAWARYAGMHVTKVPRVRHVGLPE